MSIRDNRPLMATLLDAGAIPVQRGALFDEEPRPIASAADRVEGMMLGLAIGDALSRSTEGRTPARRRQMMDGDVRDYTVGRRAKEAVGVPSDDTQLAFWTLECLNRDGGFDPDSVARCFSRRKIDGMGQTVSKFRRSFKAGTPWHECGPESAGNGALMRIAPILIPHLSAPSTALWADALLASTLTHRDVASNASCVAFVAMLWDLMGQTEAPEPIWWLDRFLELAKPLETDAVYRPRGGAFEDFEGPLTDYVLRGIASASKRGLPCHRACDEWYSGAYLLETVPSVLYVLMRHGHDLEEAIVRAVNDTKDNDTIAAIVGAAVGALHGRKAIPQRWIDGLTGRTTDDDDGRVFELLDEARSAWGLT